MIDRNEFLNTIFGEIDDESEFICVSRAHDKKDGDGVWFANHLEGDRAWRKWNPETQSQAWYYNVSTVDGGLNDKGTMVKRGRANLQYYYVLVLDDIYDKTDAPDVEPTYKMETSAGSEQWGYALVKGSDMMLFEAVIEAIHQLGYGDAGAGGSYRLVRVPGSANLKPGREGFRSVVKEWSPERYWTLESLAVAFGLDINNLPVKKARQVSTGVAAAAMEGVDPMLTWLSDNKLVAEDTGAEWVRVVCPWANTHTSGDGSAGYSPLGRGSGDWVKTRAFKCLHEHCRDRKLKELVAWAKPQGGPEVGGYDPLPWYQSRYVLVRGDKVADLVQRPRGGDWIWDRPAWAAQHQSERIMTEDGKYVAVPVAWLNSSVTVKAEGTAYHPVLAAEDVGLSDRRGQLMVNTYVPAIWGVSAAEPSIFLAHMDYLMPDAAEREVVLDWLAYKMQHPASRSYAVCMVAEDAQGIGRSWLKRFIQVMLGGHVNTVGLEELFGKDTSQFNGYLSSCQYLVVEEAKAGSMSAADFTSGYEYFKTICDTAVSTHLINPKYDRQKFEEVFFNVLVFSNNADALQLPDDDRRVYVVTNPRERQSFDYYETLQGALDGAEPMRAFNWLMARDVSGYDHIYPPMTAGKAVMIHETRSPAAVIWGVVEETFEADLVTKKRLRQAVISAASAEGFDKIVQSPGGITNRLWRKMGSLRPSEPRHGARYYIEGERQEVRAIRGGKKWGLLDEDRDGEAIKEHLSGAAIGSVLRFPK